MKFRNLHKFSVAILGKNAFVIINGLKQGLVIMYRPYCEYSIYLDDRKHGLAYTKNKFDVYVWIYSRGNLMHRINYELSSQTIVAYEHYLNNQLHGRTFFRTEYYLSDSNRSRFTDYKYGIKEGYTMEYKYRNSHLILCNKTLYLGNINMTQYGDY